VTIKEKKILICPHCEKECGTAAGLATHVKFCAVRPEFDVLLDLVTQGMTAVQVADELGLTHRSTARYLAEAGLDAGLRQRLIREAKLHKSDGLDVCLGMAPFYQPGSSCDGCEMKDVCTARLEAAGGDGEIPWWPCEAPEVIVVQRSRRRWPML